MIQDPLICRNNRLIRGCVIRGCVIIISSDLLSKILTDKASLCEEVDAITCGNLFGGLCLCMCLLGSKQRIMTQLLNLNATSYTNAMGVALYLEPLDILLAILRSLEQSPLFNGGRVNTS